MASPPDDCCTRDFYWLGVGEEREKGKVQERK